MRTLRLSLVGTVILALLGGLGGAVVAQSDKPAPATQISGVVRDQDHVIPATCTDVDGVEECSAGWVEYVFEWSDPRLPSAGWVVVNSNRFDVADASDQGRVAIGMAGLDGPDGSWVGEAIGVWLPDEDSVVLWILEGEGAYDGMTAFLRDSGSGISGHIVESELPSMPVASQPPSTLEQDVRPELVTLLVCEEKYSGSLSGFADDGDPDEAQQLACHDLYQLQNMAEGMPVAAKGSISGYSNIHAPEFLTDGKYGNSYSWVAAGRDSWIKLDLQETTAFDVIRFGRDRLEGGYSDRDPGRFTIAIADKDTFEHENDANDTVEYQVIFDSAGAGFDGAISAGESIVVAFPEPIEAQYVKLSLARDGAAVDEIELLAFPDHGVTDTGS